jgi:hypothetical protein
MKTVKNRMAEPETRNPKPSPEPLPAPAVAVSVPVATPGLICPCCGRGMVPRVYSTRDKGRYASCSLCAGKFFFTTDAANKPISARRL